MARIRFSQVAEPPSSFTPWSTTRRAIRRAWRARESPAARSLSSGAAEIPGFSAAGQGGFLVAHCPAARNSQDSHTCENDRLTSKKILLYSLFVWRIVVAVRGV